MPKNKQQPPRGEVLHEYNPGCPMPGVGGRHSDTYGIDGTGRCVWCGAAPTMPDEGTD